MKKLPLGIQTFSKMIEGDYLYIDKTEQIYNLITYSGQYYFLARPRRFGKSLLISTLQELFSGNRALFEGLWIEDKIDWQPYPVVHIDFTGLEYDTPGTLQQSLKNKLQKIALQYNIQLPDSGYKSMFGQLIESLAAITGRQAVILIDEYDKPIIDHINDKQTAAANHKILGNFYSIIKSVDRHIRFVLITGVSKFSRVSIFSGLNNLNDITIDDRFSTLMGYTHQELLTYFPTHLQQLQQKLAMPQPELLATIKRWYNGYSWDGAHFLYNPFSILSLFNKLRFGNYWFASGTPTFLIDLIKSKRKNIADIETQIVDESLFESFDIDHIEVLSLLFQTGYLTIKKVESLNVKSLYTLSYPNQEVKESLLKHLLSTYTPDEPATIGSLVLDLTNTLRANDIDAFLKTITGIFASIPYHIFIREREAYYHTIIYVILSLIGVNIDVEIATNQGRIDAVVQTDTDIYIIEFKLGSSQEAMDQIKSKNYHQPYSNSPKPITLLAIGIDPKTRNLLPHITQRLTN